MSPQLCRPLFAWDELQDSPSLQQVRTLLASIPDAARQTAELTQGLPQPSGGRKEYTDDAGQVTKVVEWFGSKLHLLVDARHEVVLAYHTTDTKAGDNEEIETLVEHATANLPDDRIETLADDKAADDGKVHEAWHERGIKPVIQHRACWPKDGEQEPQEPPGERSDVGAPLRAAGR